MYKMETIKSNRSENQESLAYSGNRKALGSAAIENMVKNEANNSLIDQLGIADDFNLTYSKMYDHGVVKATDPIELRSREKLQFVESSFFDEKSGKTRKSILSVMYDDRLHRIGYMSGIVMNDETVLACGTSYSQDYRSMKKIMPDNLQKVMYDVDSLETHSTNGPYHGQDKSGDIVYSYLAYLQERGYKSLVAGSIDANDIKGKGARYKVAKNLEHYKVDDLVNEGRLKISTMFEHN